MGKRNPPTITSRMNILSVIAASRRRVTSDPDADALIAAMTVAPDSTREALIRQTIADLKDAGVWALHDEIWIRAAHTEQAALLGWKRVADSSVVSTVTFTTDQGFVRVAGYINTGFNPTSVAGNFVQNSASMWGYSRTDSNLNQSLLGGRTTATTNQNILIPRASGSMIARINQSDLGTSSLVDDSLGLFAATRSNASSVQGYRRGVEVLSYTAASDGVPDLNFFELGINTGGSLTGASSRQSAATGVGGSMTATQHGDLYDIIQAYMVAIGADV
jgi:hypothetical protein